MAPPTRGSAGYARTRWRTLATIRMIPALAFSIDTEVTMRVLLAGESWTMHTIHQKGFDSFTTTAYAEGHQWLSGALKEARFEVTYMPSHIASDHFPRTPEELAEFDVVMLSDIG